jgi:hypothetical protein
MPDKGQGRWIPAQVLDANYSIEGYFALVAHFSREMACSFKDAWQLAEDELEAHDMPPRYSSYQSFIVSQRVWRLKNMEYGKDRRREAAEAAQAARESEK